MVLEGDFETLQREVRGDESRQSSKLLDDFTCLSIDLVNRRWVSPREKIFAIFVFIDRIDMEIVPGIAGIRTCLALIYWKNGLLGRNMFQRGPFNE